MFSPLGSLNTSSSPITQIPSNVEISTQEIQNDTTKLANQDYVNKTFSNKTTYNPINSWTSISALYGFPASVPIEVTYYTINHESRTLKTYDSDFALNLGLTRNFIKILNFELRLDGELNYSYDNDTNISSCIGAAFIYPRFDVSIGDVFLYKMGDGTLGLFKINNKTRLSIDKDSAHRVDFELNRFPSKSEIDELESYVDRTAYFFKDVFLNGKVGLIYDETYQLLQGVYEYKDKLLYHFLDRFYDKKSRTFLRPDGVYDPYVVKFLFSFVNFYKLDEFPLQLLSNVEFVRRSIFSYLVEPKTINKSRVINKFKLIKKEFSHRDSDLNNLINKYYVCLSDNSEDLELQDYILNNFMSNLNNNFNSIELLLYNYTVNNTINPEILFNSLSNYNNLSDLDQFYFIPIYLFLLAVLEGIVYR